MKKRLLRIICHGSQSWGVDSPFHRFKGTQLYPSKSGIVGMIAAALGYDKGDERIDVLSESITLYRLLKSGEEGSLDYIKKGRLESDYLIASGAEPLIWAIDGKSRKKADLITKQYLADARFVLYLDAEEDVMETIYDALADPFYILYLGRKQYVTCEDTNGGYVELDIEKEMKEKNICFCH